MTPRRDTCKYSTAIDLQIVTSGFRIPKKKAFSSLKCIFDSEVDRIERRLIRKEQPPIRQLLIYNIAQASHLVTGAVWSAEKLANEDETRIGLQEIWPTPQ